MRYACCCVKLCALTNVGSPSIGVRVTLLAHGVSVRRLLFSVLFTERFFAAAALVAFYAQTAQLLGYIHPDPLDYTTRAARAAGLSFLRGLVCEPEVVVSHIPFARAVFLRLRLRATRRQRGRVVPDLGLRTERRKGVCR